jgi:hypothetical protein
MTLDELTKTLMRSCEASELPVPDRLRALGVAYVSYAAAQGIRPAEIRAFVDRVIENIEAVRGAVPNN